MGADATVYDAIDPSVTTTFIGYDRFRHDSEVTVLTSETEIVEALTDGEAGTIFVKELAHWDCRASAPTACMPWVCWWGLHHPICARSGFVAHSGRYQFGCRFSSRQYRDGHDSDGRRYGRKCGRLCSQRCRFSSQTEQIQEQQQQEVITQTIPYAYRIISTENETRPDDGAGHDRWLHPHLRVHRLVLHLARDKRTGADLHTGW